MSFWSLQSSISSMWMAICSQCLCPNTAALTQQNALYCNVACQMSRLLPVLVGCQCYLLLSVLGFFQTTTTTNSLMMSNFSAHIVEDLAIGWLDGFLAGLNFFFFWADPKGQRGKCLGAQPFWRSLDFVLVCDSSHWPLLSACITWSWCKVKKVKGDAKVKLMLTLIVL